MYSYEFNLKKSFKIGTGFLELYPRPTASQFQLVKMRQASQPNMFFELIVSYLKHSGRFENHHVVIY